MHEFGVAEELVREIARRAERDGVRHVREVRVRRSSVFAEGPLRQAFEILTLGTPLEGAALAVEEVSVEHVCEGCGRARRLTCDDLIGHVFICPDCGTAREIDEAHGLEVLGVTADDPAP